ncbi:MAG: DNA primase, partial [Lachnospiraceae bacterium]|nr:DNA primase [Lachnospiraceae bacterium]
MFYGDELIERVREANDIVDVVGTYVKLTRRGSNYVGLCPFHNEKTGSFSVNKNMQIYKCFGCGKAGNVFTFLMEYDNLNFIEAVKELADRAGIVLPEQEMTEEEKERRDMKERLFEVNKAAAGFYFRQLRSDAGRKAYEYLKGRALSDETMKKFGYNAVRCSHNPYSEEFYDLADEMGLLVLDELVDKWSDRDWW